jgi:50S ribosomal protein L16 3-hydroxylase
VPARCAHNGIAEGDCMAYSIGFRTPSYQELGEQFLVHLQDHLCLEGMYADPDLKIQTHPSEISADMLRQVENAIKRIKWDKTDIANFLGCYLSEPKSHIFFEPPDNPCSFKSFQKELKEHGISLDLKTQMLCQNNCVFVNGESNPVDKASYTILRSLADRRQLEAISSVPETALNLMYQWYMDGYLAPKNDKWKR